MGPRQGQARTDACISCFEVFFLSLFDLKSCRGMDGMATLGGSERASKAGRGRECEFGAV